jgi:hypothetical protein
MQDADSIEEFRDWGIKGYKNIDSRYWILDTGSMNQSILFLCAFVVIIHLKPKTQNP